MYNENGDYNGMSGLAQPEHPQSDKDKKPKKKKNIFFKIIASVVCAVLLGGVAGVACYGVSYAGYVLFPIKSAEGGGSPSDENQTHGNLSYTDNSEIKKDIKATVYLSLIHI